MRVFLAIILAVATASIISGCALVEEEAPRSEAESSAEGEAAPEEVAATMGKEEITGQGEAARPAENTSGAREETAPEETRPEGTRSEPENVYSETMRTEVPERLRDVPERVYVPNTGEGTVDVIDPETYQIIDSYPVGTIPHHVTPSYDMSELYVNNEGSNSFTVIDPISGQPSGEVQVPFPYNLYFTPDGEKAIIVVERLQTVEFRNPETWELMGSVFVPSPGVDHMDFSADGDYLIGSTEWGGDIIKIDTEKMELVDSLQVGGAPVDVKLSPDGETFFVANQGEGYGGLHVIDPETMEETGFIPTGTGAHGLYPSKDAESLYVANRLEGSISVVDFETGEVVEKWNVGGSPDMIQLNPEGTEMWYADRYNNTVSVVSTENGELLHRIEVGTEPHGITYFPNVGDFNLGHNGIYR